VTEGKVQHHRIGFSRFFLVKVCTSHPMDLVRQQMDIKQSSLATARLELPTKRKRMIEFLEEKNVVVPWADLVSLLQSHAPSCITGRPPFAL
jgi:hypothetical protein